jgi:hypothetical protein
MEVKKMTDKIKMEVPLSGEALRHAAKMFSALADSVEGVVTTEDEVKTFVEDSPENMEQRIDDVVNKWGTAELAQDSTGTFVPWDPRIHSSGKTILKDGKWKLVRNVDPGLLNEVEAELRAYVCTPDPVNPTGTTGPPVQETDVTTGPPGPPAPATEQTTPVTEYSTLVQLITKRGDGLGMTDIADACAACGAALAGFTSLPALAQVAAKEYIPLVAEELEKIWTARG